MTRFGLARKYSRTAFFNHWLTCQPSFVGSATRRSPLSSRSSAHSIALRSLASNLPGASSARCSHAASITASSLSMRALHRVVEQLQQRRTHIGTRPCTKRRVVFVTDQEEILHAFAESGDARIMHAN